MRQNYDDITTISYIGLLLCFAILMLGTPFLPDLPGTRWLVKLSYTAVLLFAIFSITHRRLLIATAAIFLIPGIIVDWMAIESELAYTLKWGSNIIFYGIAAGFIARHIFTTKRVDLNIIYGAICLYVLLGFMWSAAFTLLELLSPGSFTGLTHIDNTPYGVFFQLFYFSFITLTTLGYGNIAPLSVPANALASTEALVGQLYLTVLIARLVGMHIAERSMKR